MPALATRPALLLATTLLLAGPLPAFAQSGWTGAVSSDWFDPGNWSNGVPDATDNVNIETPTPDPAVISGGDAFANWLVVAQYGSSRSSLVIENGGTLTDVHSRIGNDAGSQGAVTVSGAGSTWNAGPTLLLGVDGSGSVAIADGGTVNSSQAWLGFSAGAQGSATITGAGSNWTTGSLVAGNFGTGSVRVSDGGRLSSTFTVMGNGAGGGGGNVVTGVGSAWNMTGALIVGNEGLASLVITNGGTVASTAGAAIGNGGGGQGTVSVLGAGSAWNVVGGLTVGAQGTGFFELLGGALVADSVDVGEVASGVGSVTLRGDGSDATIGNELVVGDGGTGTLLIDNGGTMAAGGIVLGRQAGAQGTLTVSDAGSLLTHTGTFGDFVVGLDGSGTLAITAGGTVDGAGNATLGAGNGSGEATVTGAGARWRNSGLLTVGDNASGTLAIDGQGVVESGEARLGETAAGRGAATVDGPGSAWNVGGDLFVGVGGSGTLDITAGGAVVTGNQGAIGYGAGSTGAVAASGAGSAWDVGGGLVVGNAGIGTLAIDGGATVASATGEIGEFDGAEGHVVVSGAGSSWTNTGFLEVGGGPTATADIGGLGTLTVAGGGAVANADGHVGFAANSRGIVTVTGAGSTWTNAGTLRIGRGGSGTLTIADGGVVSATGAVHLGNLAGATGVLNIGAAAGDPAAAAGTLDAAALQFGAGSGTLVFNHTAGDYAFGAAIGGSGAIEQLAGTTILAGSGDAAGTTNVRGGTLQVEGSLGDTTATVFGGATLGGSGRIAGGVTVQDGGVLAPGSSAGTLTLGSLSLSEGSILDYELGQAGVIGGGVNDLIEINGNLILDGTLDITDIGGFGVGVYRLMNYGGALTDNGLELGALPTGFDAQDLFVQTGIAGQVNLVNSAGLMLSFWDGAVAAQHNDGAVDGGDGVWNADNDNWTADDGAVNGRWDDGVFAVFGGAGGDVQVVGEQAVAGMQFMSGYTLAAGAGGALRIDHAESVVRVDPDATATIAAPIAGAGGLVKSDTGTLVLSGENTYAGGTRIDGGTLQVSRDANLGDAAGALTLDGGTLRNTVAFDSARTVTLLAEGGTFDTAADLGLGGAIGGAGALVKAGAGTLTLTGRNTYTGGTRVLAGTLVGDADTIRGDLDNAGTVVFDQATDATYAGDVAGSGAMAKRGAGVLTLAGTSALDWSIDAGTLVAQPARFDGDAAIASGATFRFADATGAYAGVLSGAGRLEIAGGASPFAFTGDSGGFAGSTALQSGTLRIDGALGGRIGIAAGAALTGTGTLGSVDNAGTLAPGNSIGTLTLIGDYVHRDGAVFEAEIEPGGGSDLLDVAGSATIEGGTVEVSKAPGQYAGGTRYTLIDAAGGVSGEFGALEQDLPFLDLLLAYDANHVYLDVARSDVDFDIVCGEGTFNQCQVADALDRIGGADPLPPDLETALTEVTTLTLDQARAGFDRLSGEAHASLAGAMLEGHALYGQTVARRLAARREAVGATRLQGGVWARGYGVGSELDGDGNAHGAKLELYGLAVGADAWANESWLVGASLNALKLDADFRAGDGGEADAKNVSLYTSVQGERGYVDAVASYAWWAAEVQRRIEVGDDIHRDAHGDYGMHRFAAYVEAGLDYALAGGTLQPLLSAEWSLLSTERFRETGAGELNLIGSAQNVERTVASAGLRWRGDYGAGEWTFAPVVQARWLHTFGDRHAEFGLAFAGAPEVTYRVRGVTVPEDRGLLGVGFQASRENLDLFLDLDYQAGGGFEAAGFGAGLRWRW